MELEFAVLKALILIASVLILCLLDQARHRAILWHTPRLIDNQYWIDCHCVNVIQWLGLLKSNHFVEVQLQVTAGYCKMRLSQYAIELMFDEIFDTDYRCPLANTKWDFNAVWGNALR
jgi:hypothetical protein